MAAGQGMAMQNNFGSLSYDYSDGTVLDFSDVNVSEVDAGSFPQTLSFLSQYPGTAFFGAETFGTPAYDGLAWQDFLAGVIGNPSGAATSQTLTFTYDVSAGPGQQIVGLDGIIIENIVRNLGALSLTESN